MKRDSRRSDQQRKKWWGPIPAQGEPPPEWAYQAGHEGMKDAKLLDIESLTQLLHKTRRTLAADVTRRPQSRKRRHWRTETPTSAIHELRRTVL